MSRIGKLPIQVPEGVEVAVKAGHVKVAKGDVALEQSINPGININYDQTSRTLVVERANDSKPYRAMHGLYRSLLNNMVVGLTQGFKKELAIVGVGYRAELREGRLHLQLGYSHPIVFFPPKGIEIIVEKPTSIVIKGYDKQLVGQIAAKIRSFRPPEPYKGKGIRYVDESIRRKAGKAAG